MLTTVTCSQPVWGVKHLLNCYADGNDVLASDSVPPKQQGTRRRNHPPLQCFRLNLDYARKISRNWQLFMVICSLDGICRKKVTKVIEENLLGQATGAESR